VSFRRLSTFLPNCPDFSRLKSFLNLLVYLIVLIKTLNQPTVRNSHEFASPRRLDCFDCFGVGLERQCLVLGNALNQQVDNCRCAKAHRPKDSLGLLHGLFIYMGFHNSSHLRRFLRILNFRLSYKIDFAISKDRPCRLVPPSLGNGPRGSVGVGPAEATGLEGGAERVLVSVVDYGLSLNCGCRRRIP
jgi:hypothetical protein